MITELTSRKSKTEWTRWRNANFDFFRRHLEPLPRSLKFVDLGAGALHFKDLFTQFDYVGVDFQAYPGVSIIADLNRPIPLETATADIVMLSNTLEHIAGTENLLRECRRILKKGGTIIGTIPFLMRLHQAPHDFNRYTSYKLEQLLFEAGFTAIRVEPLGSLIDAYDTMENKFFADLSQKYKVTTPRGLILRLIRLPLRLGTFVARLLFGHVPASNTMTEGFGFIAKA